MTTSMLRIFWGSAPGRIWLATARNQRSVSTSLWTDPLNPFLTFLAHIAVYHLYQRALESNCKGRLIKAGSQSICYPLCERVLPSHTVCVTRCICCHGDSFCFVLWQSKPWGKGYWKVGMCVCICQCGVFHKVLLWKFQVREKDNEDSLRKVKGMFYQCIAKTWSGFDTKAKLSQLLVW